MAAYLDLAPPISTVNNPEQASSPAHAQASSSANPLPSVSITPASPAVIDSARPDHLNSDTIPPAPAPTAQTSTPTTMPKEKIPTESETALLAQAQPLSTAGNPSLSRRSSGKKLSISPAAEPAIQEKPMSTAPPPPTRSPAAVPAPSTAKPAASTSRISQQKKKRKRKGFASLLLAFGCLSASDFEDDPKVPSREEVRQQLASLPGPSTTTPGTPTSPTAPASPSAPVSAPPAALESRAQPTETASTTLVGGEGDKGVFAEEPKPDGVVVAPVEPVTLPDEETAGVTSSAVQPPGGGTVLLSTPPRPSIGRRDSSPSGTPAAATPEADRTETSGGYSDISESGGADEGQGEDHGDEYNLEDEYEDEEDRLIAQGGIGIPLDENGNPAPLLPMIDKVHIGRKCLVLDLDETLLHSSFKMLPSADFIVPVEIESQLHNVYVIKRPGVDHFLQEMGKIYEVVIFTASLSKYADPVLDKLDTSRVVKHRLFRESCYNHKGNFVKDLSQLGRDLETSIIIDNSPASYIFHPNNAVPVSTWFNDPHDTELTDLCPFLADLATVEDIRGVLDGSI